jgi:hypothetical protein
MKLFPVARWARHSKRDTCTDLGGTFVSAATGSATYFKLECGLDYVQNKIAGGDVWADDFETCLNACARWGATHSQRCLAVSYAPDAPTSEIVNCYMKASNDPVALFTPTHRVWTAFVVDGPQGGLTSEPVRTISVTSVTSVTQSVVITTVSQLQSTDAAATGSTFTSPGPQSPTPEGSMADQTSRAWIAGPAVGAVVGVALIGTGIWLLLRRRMRQLPEDFLSTEGRPNLFTAGVGDVSVMPTMEIGHANMSRSGAERIRPRN